MNTLTVAIATPFPISHVRLLDGQFKQRQLVHAEYLLMIDPDRLLVPFRAQAGLAPKAEHYGGWESRSINGHSLGHYLSALSQMYAATGDQRMRDRVNTIIDELADCQAESPDGALLPVPRQIYDDLHAGKIDATPFGLNGCWVPNYTMHKVFAGLRDAYQMAGNIKALAIERKLADWLDGILATLNAEQIQEMLRAEHGGMNDVLAHLAADTGDDRYLKMAERCFHHRAVLDPLFNGRDELNGQHGNTQIPKVIGLAREYELTGDERYRTAVETFWHNVVERRSYAIGGHGESEHFFPVEQFPQKLTPFTAETCNTYNMLKLTGHLFAWEPDAATMDFVERALINHLLANIGRQPGEFGYFLGLGSVGMKVFSTKLDAWWCCVGTGMENPPRYGELAYFHDDESIWVNLFIASNVEWPEKGVTLRQETNLPDGDTVRFTFTCDVPQRLSLKIRHPYWCAAPQVKINGAAVRIDSAPSSYLTLNGAWRTGDTIDIHLPMSLRLESLPHSDENIVAVMYGPMVLAGIVPADPNVPDPAKLRYDEHLKARGKSDAFPPVLVAPDAAAVLSHLRPTGRAFAEFHSDGIVKPHDLTFIPLHRVYEEHYAVYFSRMTADEWATRQIELAEEQKHRAQVEAATIDTVTPGYQQPEVEHAMQSQNSTIQDFLGRKSRLAKTGGWFSYDMAVAPKAGELLALVATYWGGEWEHRTFDILIDGQVIATQQLRTNKPGDFFDATYSVPPELTRGKAKVTVKFLPHPNQTAGGVYGLRMMQA